MIGRPNLQGKLHSRRSPRWFWRGCASISRWWIAHEWEVTIGIGVISICLGFLGFLAKGLSHREGLYRAIILFTCNTGPQDGEIPLPLEIGRWGSFFAVFYATMRGLSSLIASRLHLWNIRGHVVICGFGEKGKNLTGDFLRQGTKVVAIDSDLRRIEKMDDHSDLIPVTGSANSRDTLARCGASKANIVLAVTGEDDVNLQVALILYRLHKRGKPRENPLRCFVHVWNHTLMRLCHQHFLFSQPHRGISFRLFNMFENSARVAFERYSPDRFQGPDKTPLHILIIGCGNVGYSLLLQAAKIGHFPQEKPLKVTVIDQHGMEIERRLSLQYPAIREILDLRFIPAPLESLGEKEFQDLHREHPLQVVFLCIDQAILKVETAFRLRRYLMSDPPQLVLMLTSRSSGLTDLLTDDKALAGQPWEAPIHALSLIDEGSGVEQVIQEKIDCLAKAFHNEYLAQRKPKHETVPSSPAFQAWDRLPEEFRESNRQAADHLPIKLRAIGRSETSHVEPLTREEIPLLSRMEHQRWRAERLLNGWKLGSPRDNARRIHPLLVPWKDLDADCQRSQMDSIATLPDLINKLHAATRSSDDEEAERGAVPN